MIPPMSDEVNDAYCEISIDEHNTLRASMSRSWESLCRRQPFLEPDVTFTLKDSGTRNAPLIAPSAL
jgi:hypothetical protein